MIRDSRAQTIGQLASRFEQDIAAAIAETTDTARELSQLVDEIEGAAARLARDADLRTSERFPIHLPVRIAHPGGSAEATLGNIVHGVVCLQMRDMADVPDRLLLAIPGLPEAAVTMRHRTPVTLHCAITAPITGRLVAGEAEAA